MTTGFEKLEDRTLLAANVIFAAGGSLASPTLNIGLDDGNLTLENDGTQTILTVASNDGAPVTANALPPQLGALIVGGADAITGVGTDVVSLSYLNSGGNIATLTQQLDANFGAVAGSSADDSLDDILAGSTGITVGGNALPALNLNIVGDFLAPISVENVTFIGLDFGGSVTINTGDEADGVAFTNSQFFAPVIVDTGFGNDGGIISGNNFFDVVEFQLGSGNGDILNFGDNSFFNGPVTVDGGPGNDDSLVQIPGTGADFYDGFDPILVGFEN